MLLKCIQNLHKGPYFGNAHYKNHASVQNVRQLKARTLILVYLTSAIDSWGGGGGGGVISQTIYELLCEILWKSMICFYWIIPCKTGVYIANGLEIP